MNKLIIITGNLASGKSTLAKALGDYLNCVVINKDELKEIECDVFDYRNREENRLLSIAAIKNMIHFFSRLALTNQDAILEANFRTDEICEIADIAKENNYEVILLELIGDYELLYERFLDRMKTRHKAHMSIGLQNDFDKFIEYNEELLNQDLVFKPHIIDMTDMNATKVFEETLKILKENKML